MRFRTAATSIVLGIAALSISAMAALAAPPLLTSAECTALAGVPIVQAVALDAAPNIKLFTLDINGAPPYIGRGQLHAVCRLPGAPFTVLGDLAGVRVHVVVVDSPVAPLVDLTVNGPGVASPGWDVEVGPFDGTATFTLISNTPLLSQAQQPIGLAVTTVDAVGGQPVQGPSLLGAIYATPYDSVFGAIIDIGALTPIECIAANGNLMVAVASMGPAQNITLVGSSTNGPFTGQGHIEARCVLPTDPPVQIPLSQVTVAVGIADAPSGPAVTFDLSGPGVGQSGPTSFVIGPFNGSTIFTLSSPTPGLDMAPQPIALYVELLGSVSSTPIAFAGLPNDIFGGVYAQLTPSAAATPELDSLLLFGSGLAGVGSYAIMRVRARRR